LVVRPVRGTQLGEHAGTSERRFGIREYIGAGGASADRRPGDGNHALWRPAVDSERYAVSSGCIDLVPVDAAFRDTECPDTAMVAKHLVDPDDQYGAVAVQLEAVTQCDRIEIHPASDHHSAGAARDEHQAGATREHHPNGAARDHAHHHDPCAALTESDGDHHNAVAGHSECHTGRLPELRRSPRGRQGAAVLRRPRLHGSAGPQRRRCRLRARQLLTRVPPRVTRFGERL